MSRDRYAALVGALLMAVGAALGAVVHWGGRRAPALERFEYEHPAMGTLFRAVLYARSEVEASAAVGEAWDAVDRIERAATDYDRTSEARRLPELSAGGRPHTLSPELLRVVRATDEIVRETDGAFDPTVGALTHLWRRALRRGEWPSHERWEAARRSVGWARIVDFDAEAGTIVVSSPDARLDFGGIAKGVAIDAALEALGAAGIRSALVDGGGDIAVSAPPPGTEGWNVTVELDGASEPRRLVLVHEAVATSGDAEQGVESLVGEPPFALPDGWRRLGHVLDPRNATPLPGPRGAACVARTAARADGRATALLVLGPSSVGTTQFPSAVFASPVSGAVSSGSLLDPNGHASLEPPIPMGRERRGIVSTPRDHDPDSVAETGPRRLRLELQVRDVLGAPLEGPLVGLVRSHGEDCWRTFNAETVDRGRLEIVLADDDGDLVTIAATHTLLLSCGAERQDGVDPWAAHLLHLEPTSAACVHDRELSVDRGPSGDLVCRGSVRLESVPHYCTVEFTQPLPGGFLLAHEELDANGAMPSMTGDTLRRFVEAPVGASRIDLFTWSDAPILHASLFDPFEAIVDSGDVRKGTTLILDVRPRRQTELRIDRGTFPDACFVVMRVDGRRTVPDDESGVLTIAEADRIKAEALDHWSVRRLDERTIAHDQVDAEFELWSCATGPAGRPGYVVSSIRSRSADANGRLLFGGVTASWSR